MSAASPAVQQAMLDDQRRSLTFSAAMAIPSFERTARTVPA